MKTIRTYLLALEVELIYRLFRAIPRIPDRVFAFLFRTIHAVALPFVDDEESLMHLRDFEQIFAGGPPMSTALRRVILDARPRQLKSTIRGFILNHLRKERVWISRAG